LKLFFPFFLMNIQNITEVSLTYLRGLEVEDLKEEKEEDMPMV